MSGRGRPENCLAKIRQKILTERNGKILGMVRYMLDQALNFCAFVFFYFVILSLDFSDAVNGKRRNLVHLQMQNLFSGHSVVAYGSVDTYPAASASSGGKRFDES